MQATDFYPPLPKAFIMMRAPMHVGANAAAVVLADIGDRGGDLPPSLGPRETGNSSGFGASGVGAEISIYRNGDAGGDQQL